MTRFSCSFQAKGTISSLRKSFWLYSLILFCAGKAISQEANISQWIQQLKDDGKTQVLSSFAVTQILEQYDSTEIRRFIGQIEKETVNGNRHLEARVKGLKAKLLFYNLGPGDSLYADFMKSALSEAYALDDPYMIAEFSRSYGEMLNSLGNQQLAAQYCMNALKIEKELGFQYFPTVKTFYLTTAEMLYLTINIPEALPYYRYAFSLPDDSLNPKRYKEFKEYVAQCLNTVGKIHHNLKNYDSAIYYYELCIQYVHKNKLPEDLAYIASDNRFDPYIELQQYDSCINIAENLYQSGLPNDSMTLLGACFMKGRIALRTGSLKEALKWDHQAEEYGKNRPKFLLNVYRDLASAYDQLNQKDIAYLYVQKYQPLMDANKEIRRQSSAAFLEAESEFQKSKILLGKLGLERRAEVRERNIIIIAIILLAIAGIFYFYFKRKKSETARRAAEEKYHFFETQYQTAEEQLAIFKKEADEKNRQIESLVTEKNDNPSVRDHIRKIDALSRQIILTESDWEMFRQNFDTVYPGFYTALRQRVPAITNAEARMACLIRLNFDAKHIAGMLGISQTSVRKTRYRLKKRFEGGDPDRSLEDIITAL